jgi:hypothetical protein
MMRNWIPAFAGMTNRKTGHEVLGWCLWGSGGTLFTEKGFPPDSFPNSHGIVDKPVASF